MSNNMKENVLADKSKTFAVQIITLCRYLNEAKREYVLSKQLLRSGTSIGANAKEAAYAPSKADLTNKLFIAQKECAETEYWLEILHDSGYIDDSRFNPIYQNCKELLRLLLASTKTLQGKSNE